MTYAIATSSYAVDHLPQPEAAIGLTVAHIATTEDKHKKIKKIVLPTMEGLSFEKVRDIAYLEASGNYTVLHFMDGRQVLVCRTLCDIEAQLPDSSFIRIHRSHTVHLRHIKKYLRGKGGQVLLHSGATLSVSAGQKEPFLDAVKKYFG